MAPVVLVAALLASPPLADRVAPATAGGHLVADDARSEAHGTVAGALFTTWAKDPVVLRAPDGTVSSALVSQQLAASALASLALVDRLTLTVRAGGLLQERAHTPLPSLAGLAPSAPHLAAKLTLVDVGVWSFAARAAFDAPTSLSIHDALFAPALLTTFDLGVVIVSADLAARVSAGAVPDAAWSLGARVPVNGLHDATGGVAPRLEVLADLVGETGLSPAGTHPIEGVAGVRAQLGPVALEAGAGGGLVAGPGTPRARVFMGASFSLDALFAPAPVVVVAPAVVSQLEEPAAPIVPPREHVVIEHDQIRFDSDRVFFDVGSAKLLPAGERVMREVAVLLLMHPEIDHVIVEGHADSTGAERINQQLSAQRAAAVRDFLVDAGVERVQFELAAIGTDRPAASNDTEEGRRMNRRVELHVVGAPQPPPRPLTHNDLHQGALR